MLRVDSNQTNLALKGIIGIEAMSAIATLTGNFEDSKNFSTIAHEYIRAWQPLATVPGDLPHTNLNYNNETSWGKSQSVIAAKPLGKDRNEQTSHFNKVNLQPN
jgi:hypothetical protein